MSFLLRRLRSCDAEQYRRLRMEGLHRHPDCFRIDPEDEATLPLQAWEAKLESSFVLGGFQQESLVGSAGLSVFPGAKVRHKALLWGMYVRQECQGQGLADQLIEGLVKQARRLDLQQVQLTVIAQNPRACKVYERWGFEIYATESESGEVPRNLFG